MGEERRMTIINRLSALRRGMKDHHMQAYIIPTDDFHGSEYVGEYFKTRVFMSGFTGSAGTLVVTEEEAALWTDGRYFLQAEEQLKGTTIRLMKMGEPDVEEIPEYLHHHLPAGSVIGFDGRTMTTAFVRKLCEETEEMTIVADQDLCGEIWEDRPAISCGKVWELETSHAGQSRAEKLEIVRKKIREQEVDLLLLSSLEEIAWLLNLRGSDVDYTPVFLAFMLISRNRAKLYLHSPAISTETRTHLALDGVELDEYEQVYTDLSKIPGERSVWLDPDTANYRLYDAVPEEEQLLLRESPVILLKAIKNEQEIRLLKEAHVKDGVAVTRFMYWLKHRVGQEEITEISAAEKLQEFRRQMEGYREESFEPIIGYGPHGAIIHYSASEESNCRLEARGLCLADTGAHYHEGTTDVTRTFVLGEVTPEEKRMFTLVLQGHLQLGTAKFRYGVCGQNLDYLAREPLWREGLDYRHGTGHGVGFLLSVHEGPQRIQWRVSDQSPAIPLEEGMVISNEPGVYLEGKFGVRHENLLLCRKAEKTEYGQFMTFENLTMVPFDKEGIDLELMTEKDIERLNAYHKEVYETLSPWFTGEEKQWLREVTLPLTK